MVVYVMDRHSRLVIDPTTIPLTANATTLADGLWALLDVVDPPSAPVPTAWPCFRGVDRKKCERRGTLSLVD